MKNINKKCDTCINFLKMKSLNESRALCSYYDCRIYSSGSGNKCAGYERPKYTKHDRIKNKKIIEMDLLKIHF